MRAWIRLSVAFALAVLPAAAWSQEHAAEPAAPSATQGQPPADSPQPITDNDNSIAAAARKARDQKKAAKPVKVFTNDDVASSSAATQTDDSSKSAAGTNVADGAAKASGNDEKSWRDKFAKLHEKLDHDKEEVSVMERELGVLNLQYYNDPVKAMQQQYSRDDINKKSAEIEAKKKEIDADQQAIDDAEDALRKAGGDPGWAR
jgi:hypothetical protein